MILRKHLLATLGTGLVPILSMSYAQAMTVHPVQVKSAIGEPFRAEISITGLGSIDLRDIDVKLASPRELMQLGISARHSTQDLNLSLLATQSNNGASQGTIVVRSRQPINTPFLEFAVKIKAGPNNRIQRINALIDPPKSKKTIINLTPAPADHNEIPLELANTSMPTLDNVAQPIPQNNSTDITRSEQTLLVSHQTPPAMDKDASASSKQHSANRDTPTPPSQPKEIDISSTDNKNKPKHLVKRNESLWKIAKQLQPQLNKPIGQIMQQIREMNTSAFINGDPNQLKRGATLVLPEHNQQAVLVNNTPTPTKTKKPKTPSPTKTQPKAPPRHGRLPKAEMTLVAPKQEGMAQGNAKDGRHTGPQPLSRELSSNVVSSRRKTVLLQHEVSELDAQLALNDKKIAMLNAKLAELEQQLKMRNNAQKKHSLAKASQAVMPLLAFVAVILSGISPNIAQAADGDSSGFPLWIIPVGLLIAAVAIKLIKGKEPANKRRPARKKSNRPAQPQRTPAQTKATPVQPAAPVAIDRTAPVAPSSDILQDAQQFIEQERFTQATDILKNAIYEHPTRPDLQIKLLEVYALQNDTAAFEQQYQTVIAFDQTSITLHADKLRQLLQEANQETSTQDSPTAPYNDPAPLEFTSATEAKQPNATQEETYLLDDSEQLDNAPSVDQSLAELEAELGFEQPSSSTAQPAPEAPVTPQTDNVVEFDLSEFNTTDADKNAVTTAPNADENLDLEFDLSDSFDLGESMTPEAEVPQVNTTAADTTAKAEPTTEPSIALEEIKLDDTNWATGFDDQEFDIDTTTTDEPASPQPAETSSVEAPTPAVTPPPAEPIQSDDFLLQEFPFLQNIDEQQTNLELAESYINLGEIQSAQELLDEVAQKGNPQQQTQAQQLTQKLAS